MTRWASPESNAYKCLTALTLLPEMQTKTAYVILGIAGLWLGYCQGARRGWCRNLSRRLGKAAPLCICYTCSNEPMQAHAHALLSAATFYLFGMDGPDVPQVPALNIFETSYRRGKFDESRKLSNGSLMEFKHIYPMDAVFDTPADVPADVSSAPSLCLSACACRKLAPAS